MEQLEAMGFESAQIEAARKQLRPDARKEEELELLLELLLGLRDVPRAPGEAIDSVLPPNTVADSTENLLPTGLRGEVLSLPISQYDFGSLGTSACTAISIAAIKNQLLKLDDIDDNAADITSILMDSIQEGVIAATQLAATHLALEEVWPLVPSFFESGVCREAESVQAILSVTEECFAELLAKAVSLPVSVVGIVITKPPMTVSVLVDNRGEKPKYRLFDSHTRPEFGLTSAYVCTSDDLRECALNLKTLFPRISNVVEELAVELSYHSFEAHFFHTRPPPPSEETERIVDDTV